MKYIIVSINIFVVLVLLFVTRDEKFILLVFIYPFYEYLCYKKKVKIKEEKIEKIKRELPNVILEYLIYQEADISLFNSLINLVKVNNNPFICGELKKVLNQIRTGKNSKKAFFSLINKYDLKNLDTFLRYLIQEFEKGEIDSKNYRTLLENIYIDRLLNIKVRAQKTQTKLIIPMTIIFIDVIVVSIYPALCQMKL